MVLSGQSEQALKPPMAAYFPGEQNEHNVAAFMDENVPATHGMQSSCPLRLSLLLYFAYVPVGQGTHSLPV